MPRLSALAFCLDNYGFVRHGRFGYNVRFFTGTESWTCPTGVSEVEYLVVGGGGGGGLGGTASGGGGGGGGVLYGTLPVTAGNSYPVVVGSGGASSASGESSSFNSPALVAAGGGAGGFEPSLNGTNGGSGGGGSGGTPGFAGAGGNGNVPAVSPPQGNNGGTGSSTAPLYSAGGGGGALTAGSSGADGGKGGAGIFTTISGRSFAYGGGGGGGQSAPGIGGLGGAGGGGNGSYGGSSGSNGAALRGGGGGGSGNASPSADGGSGGSGVVILRYRQSASSVTVFNSSGYWRCPHNATSIDVLAIGSGGGGGLANQHGSGAGGGAGMFTYVSGIDNMEPGKLYYISIAAGGAGSTTVDTAGANSGINYSIRLISDESTLAIGPLGTSRVLMVGGWGGQGSSANSPGGPDANDAAASPLLGGSSVGGGVGRQGSSFPGATWIPAGPFVAPFNSPKVFAPGAPPTGYGGGAGYTSFPRQGYQPATGDAPFPNAPFLWSESAAGAGGGAGGAGQAAYVPTDSPGAPWSHTGQMTQGGNAGNGVSSTITGTTIYIGGGGGGAGWSGGYGHPYTSGPVAPYALHGGGAGASYNVASPFYDATNARANSGGGGGGGSRFAYGTSPGNKPAANGGSGLVIIRTYGL